MLWVLDALLQYLYPLLLLPAYRGEYLKLDCIVVVHVLVAQFFHCELEGLETAEAHLFLLILRRRPLMCTAFWASSRSESHAPLIRDKSVVMFRLAARFDFRGSG